MHPNPTPALIVLFVIVAILLGGFYWPSGPKRIANIEVILLLETEAGVRAEYSLGLTKSMSDCRGMGAIEAAPDVDGYWIDPNLKEIGDEESGWTYYLVTGFVCRS